MEDQPVLFILRHLSNPHMVILFLILNMEKTFLKNLISPLRIPRCLTSSTDDSIGGAACVGCKSAVVMACRCLGREGGGSEQR